MDMLRSLTSDVIAKSLDGHYARQKAIVSNIANAETPNYRKRNVVFQDELQSALHQARNQGSGKTASASNDTPLTMRALQPGHFDFERSPAAMQRLGAQEAYGGERYIDATAPQELKEEGYTYRNDGNNVDLEREMVALSKNAGKFKSLITFQSRINQQLKGVIKDTQ